MKRDVRDVTATALYVEARITFSDQPDIRLWTRWHPQKAAAVLYAEGVWHGYYGPRRLEEPATVEVWAEILLPESRMGAQYATRELYGEIERAYRNINTWGSVGVPA